MDPFLPFHAKTESFQHTHTQSQLTWLYAFSLSGLQITLGTLLLNLASIQNLMDDKN